MQSVTLGCGQGGCGCGCSQAFGSAARHKRYPKIEGALKAYIDQQLRENRYFYINSALNSSNVTPSSFSGAGFGAIPADLPSNSGLVEGAIASTASAVGDFFANLWGSSPPGFTTSSDSHGVTGSWDVPTAPFVSAPVVANLPAQLQEPVVQAAAQDIFGVPVSGWVIGGAAALLLVVLVTTPRTRRRAR